MKPTDAEAVAKLREHLDAPYKCPLSAERHRLPGESVSEDESIQFVSNCDSPLEIEWDREYIDFGSYGPAYPVFICKHAEYGENHTEYLNSDDLCELWEIKIRMEERAAIRRILDGAPLVR